MFRTYLPHQSSSVRLALEDRRCTAHCRLEPYEATLPKRLTWGRKPVLSKPSGSRSRLNMRMGLTRTSRLLVIGKSTTIPLLP